MVQSRSLRRPAHTSCLAIVSVTVDLIRGCGWTLKSPAHISPVIPRDGTELVIHWTNLARKAQGVLPPDVHSPQYSWLFLSFLSTFGGSSWVPHIYKRNFIAKGKLLNQIPWLHWSGWNSVVKSAVFFFLPFWKQPRVKPHWDTNQQLHPWLQQEVHLPGTASLGGGSQAGCLSTGVFWHFQWLCRLDLDWFSTLSLP